MFSYFTELNRKRVPLEPLDFVTHATCPIVHAADDRSVMETLEAIPFITRSTRAFIGDKPYRLGPTTIGMRQNPYGSRTMPNPDNKRVPMAADDPRGRGLFGAAWAVGYAARLEGSGVEAWCGASLAGPRGLVLENGRVAPLFHVASGLARAAGDPRIGFTSSDRRRVDGYAHRDADGRSIVWLANLTPEPQTIRLPGRWRHWVLDEASFDEAASGEAPVALEAGDTIPLGLMPWSSSCRSRFVRSGRLMNIECARALQMADQRRLGLARIVARDGVEDFMMLHQRHVFLAGPDQHFGMIGLEPAEHGAGHRLEDRVPQIAAMRV